MKTLKELSERNAVDTIKEYTYKPWPLPYKIKYKCSVQDAYYNQFGDGIGYGPPMSMSESKMLIPIYQLPYRHLFKYCCDKIFINGFLKHNKTIYPINTLHNKQKSLKYRGDNA